MKLGGEARRAAALRIGSSYADCSNCLLDLPCKKVENRSLKRPRRLGYCGRLTDRSFHRALCFEKSHAAVSARFAR